MDVDAAIDDRFRQWREIFRREQAVPIIVLGVKRTPAPELVIAIEDNVPDEKLNEMLDAAREQIAQGTRIMEPPT
jgi:hypothetical protein